MFLYFYYDFLATKWLNMNNPGCNPGYKNKTHLKPWKGLILHNYTIKVLLSFVHIQLLQSCTSEDIKTPGLCLGLFTLSSFRACDFISLILFEAASYLKLGL